MTTPGRLNELSAAEDPARELLEELAAECEAERVCHPIGLNQDDRIDEVTV